MRHWLLRWRIARALDEGRPLGAADARRVAADPELRRHHAALRSLEQGLVREARAWHLPASDTSRLALPERPARTRPVSERARVRRVAPWWPVAVAAGLAALFLVLREPAGGGQVDGPESGAEASVALGATPSDDASASLAPAAERRPWASLDRLARRTLAVPKTMLFSEREEALVGEAKNVVRDARRLASHLAGHVALVR